MQTDEETVTTALQDAHPSDDSEWTSELLERAESRLSPERLELLKRTLDVRCRIGRVSGDVADLVHEMRERGA